MQGLDRNSILGILIIGIIMFAWLYYQTPSKDEVEMQKRYQDSLALLESQKPIQDTVAPIPDTTSKKLPDTLTVTEKDSSLNATLTQRYGDFATAAKGEAKTYTIENDFFVALISSKGGRIISVRLKDYTTYNKKPLYLFGPDSSAFGLDLITDKTQFNTDELYFEAEGGSFHVKGEKQESISFHLKAGNGRSISYLYKLKGNDHMMDCNIRMVGMDNVIPKNQSLLDLKWSMNSFSLEKTVKNQRDASTTYFKYPEEDADYLTETTDDSLVMVAPVQWVAFKQQFFSSVLIPAVPFDKQGAFISSYKGRRDSTINIYSAILPVTYNHKADETFKMRFYFGPNHYQTLKSYDIGIQDIIPLGWSLFGYVNKWLVIPIFGFFDSFDWNYGIIILLLTIIIKIILFPIAYKTYMSSAKMRVLRPELDEINKKFEGKSPMEKQQAQMSLYKKAGVSPLAGCIPVLLQIPILFALVRFFPASIELRGQGFLWADDLSTFDSVYNFGFDVPLYGDHVSLFAILMTASTLLYTYSNSQLMAQNQQLPGMKYMIYIMPVMFLPFMNNFSAGLSYYYFLANMISFAQTWGMRFFIDEKKLHAQIEEHKKKPVKVSKWQKRLEEMQRSRQQQSKRK